MGDKVEPAPLSRSPELHFLTVAQLDQLAGLVFELAAQLHVERARLSAIEQLLLDRGVLDREGLLAVIDTPAQQERLSGELDRSLAGMLRVQMEDDDARAPLRADQRTEARRSSKPGKEA
ncbi:MAG: hypothetical protein ABI251_12850 [Mycobacteriaceae bacterium]